MKWESIDSGCVSVVNRGEVAFFAEGIPKNKTNNFETTNQKIVFNRFLFVTRHHNRYCSSSSDYLWH